MTKTTEKRMVERDVTICIALDGEKFDNERDCLAHEKAIIFNLLNEKLERIPELDDIVPLNYDDNPNNESDFRWYRVKNEDDIHSCNEVLDNYGKLIDKPGIIAVEKTVYNELYIFFYEDCVNAAKDFFKQFGFDMKLEFVKEQY